ncbi:hypothetical protein HX096_06020 [Empedobacter falsenii]|uniref:hypothetical protein n=1 Tax=Empedobacter falsenii TaxID=343874 RepID=UPI002577112E|nr:hypothetical protein [Empedobacter falsenii]MDM1547416.1 hypothetical protein [Empedobacter falsenii]
MEFNGTKEEWRLSTSYGFEVTTSKIGLLESSKSICIVSTHLKPTKESHANALLISKAPEMLQALQDSVDELREVGLSKMADYHEILIKQSTEL